MRTAPLYGLVSLLAAACAPDPPPTATIHADEAQPLPTIVPSEPAPSAPPAASAEPVASARPVQAPAGPARFDLRFEDVGLPELARAISEITGKRFVLSGPLPAIKASLYSPDRVTAEEAYQAFLTVLASNGLTVVPRGRLLVIVPSPGFGGGR